ncbi:MAG: hypothetical protein FWF92_10910 [Oscillospiraceae bacterium]|nr:hypothetical protein [Oscillospiraceae bacterium]
MEKKKIFDLENDGLGMAADGDFLYIMGKRNINKYNLFNMEQAEYNDIFDKDGKARSFIICNEFIYLKDFCDFYVLDKCNLKVIENIRLGDNLSSDICGMWFDMQKIYIAIRNGKLVVIDAKTRKFDKYEICDSTLDIYSITRNRIYAVSYKEEFFEIDKNDLQIIKKINLKEKMNDIYIPEGGVKYIKKHDKSIRAIDLKTFKTLCTAKKAVSSSMASVIGIYKDNLLIADSGQISLWDAETLQPRGKFNFPTGDYNKGVVLYENRLFGSDYHSIYNTELD